MTHDHSQHSQTQESYWADTALAVARLSHMGESSKKGAERRGHWVLRITFNPAHVARTTKAGQTPTLNLFWWLEHSFSSFYPHFCYSTQRLCTPWLHPLTLLPHSVGIVLWMKVPLCVWRAEWCMVWLGTNWVPRPRDSIETQATTNSKNKYKNNNNLKKKKNTTKKNKNSPCSWKSSLSNVCSDLLSNVTINIHQRCYWCLTYLNSRRSPI